MKKCVFHSFAPLSIAIFLLAACAAPAVLHRVPFREADFAGTRGSGSRSVVGQAYTGNSIHYAENATVDLIPVNAYTTEIAQRRFIGGENLEKAPPAYDKYLRSVQADKDGRFTFRNLPPGEYYVGTSVDWQTSHTEHFALASDDAGFDEEVYSTTSQIIFAHVSVRNGQTVKVTNWLEGR